MIEEYIFKGYVPINIDTLKDWLREDIEFSNSRNIDCTMEKEILATLETNQRFKNYDGFINDKIKLCEANGSYFKEKGRNIDFWTTSIVLYQELGKALNNIQEYEFKESSDGQLTLF